MTAGPTIEKNGQDRYIFCCGRRGRGEKRGSWGLPTTKFFAPVAVKIEKGGRRRGVGIKERGGGRHESNLNLELPMGKKKSLISPNRDGLILLLPPPKASDSFFFKPLKSYKRASRKILPRHTNFPAQTSPDFPESKTL